MTLWLSIYFVCQSLSNIVPIAECEIKGFCEVDFGFLFYHRFQTFTNGVVEGLVMMFALVMIAKDWRSQDEIDGEILSKFLVCLIIKHEQLGRLFLEN